MENVVELPVVTDIKGDPDMQLEFAKGRYPGGVVIIGYDEDGDFRFRSSLPDGPEVLWLLAVAQKSLLEAGT